MNDDGAGPTAPTAEIGGLPVHPNDIHVRHRIEAFHEEAARQRLLRHGAAKPEVKGGGDRVGRVLRPVRAVAMAVGLVLVRIGVALGAPPLDNA